MTEQESYSSEQLNDVITSTENIPKAFADTHQTIKNEIEAVNQAIETWERLAPQLYQMRKKLQVCEELLSGKRKVESILALPSGDEKTKKKRAARTGVKTFVKKKSDILTDEVIEHIREYITSDQEYHKSKDIYHYLVKEKIIKPFTGPKPEHTFAIALSRLDQEVIKYNNHYSIMAWGLPDFGSPEHSRRKTLATSVRTEKGTRVKSYGPGEPVAA